MKKKKILLVTQAQYGSLIDYYQYVLNLKEKYTIDYICWDYNRPKIETDGDIFVHYISRNGNLITRNIRFLSSVLKIFKNETFESNLIHYFRGCSLIPILLVFSKKLNLDIRTASVSPSKTKRFFYNLFLRFECVFFNKISVVSEGVKKRLFLPNKTFVIPLGANSIELKQKKKSGLHLIYIGTLTNRNLHQTVEGVQQFRITHMDLPLSYTIIGSGDYESLEKLKNAIQKYQLQEIINLPGYVPHDKLSDYLENCNIGVSYVPITDFYNFQPVTKTYEYLLSGLPVIATSTNENKKIINNKNGVLISDNPNSFYEGLLNIEQFIDKYDSNLIRANLEEHKWVNIVFKLEKHLLNKDIKKYIS